MKTNPQHLASRFLASKEWGDGAPEISFYNRALASFVEILTKNAVMEENSKYRFIDPSGQAWVRLDKAGEELSMWVLATRQIPSGKAKALEMVGRLFQTTKKRPLNLVKWYATNKPRLELLSEAATWPSRSEGGSDIFTVGPFEVHNTVGAKPAVLENVREVVGAADRVLTSTRDFRKVLYGQIYLTGQLLTSNSAAWYRFTDDDVYIRTNLKGGRGDLHHLCHELGHRYWHRFLGTNGQYANDVLFNNLARGSVEPVKMPGVGERLPFLLKGFPDDNQPVIEKYMGDRIYLTTGGYVGFRMVWDHLGKMQIEAKYPTPYSATKATEFFPECFAMYALGTLPAEYVPAFERVLDQA